MARVVFPSNLTNYTEGITEVEVSSATFRELVRQLDDLYPGIGDVLRKSAVAIDGQIYQDAWFEKIGPTSEVFFMQRIEGG
ncbi:MAG: MoaD/ThiS family protein [Gammaproteobacteria bacterium]|nr:MoaD/ThiS family protein [Gammaproteobacteria bacterium]MDE0253047.1 MoaD/ThiS family protein [Gammaproteobacteria bacterium]MDE0402309.1 MoaD/ThiS family protein [Gammaproteobacteria bacterium]